MKSRQFIIKNKRETGDRRFRILSERVNYGRKHLVSKIFLLLPLLTFQCLPLAISTAAAPQQKIAVLVPEKTSIAAKFATEFRQALAKNFNVVDESLGETAFRAATTAENPFNLTTVESKILGAAIGCDYIMLIKSGVQRRSAFGNEEFYEAFAFTYVVSSKTGRLVFWKPHSFDAETPAQAEKMLLAEIENFRAEIFDSLKLVRQNELAEKPAPNIEEVPDEKSSEAENFRPPLPYQRFKPEYTRTAYIYDVKATVDVLVDVGASGAIERTEIVRWAGFGLDESVVATVRRMNWKPATRNGKALPMRILLRYNFKKIEKEED